MQPHLHITPVHLFATVLIVFITFGTVHLLAIGHPENRAAKAWVALGF